MSSFFSSLADKAQSALKDTPIAHHISATTSRPSAEGDSPFASRTLDHFTHQIRSFQQQYSSSTTPLQRLITSEKGIAIDFDNLLRDNQTHSKELYLWGQTEAPDLKDVSDRLGWLNYVQGTLAGNLATKLEAAQVPYKDLRAAEARLAPRRALRANLEVQIRRLESENLRGKDLRVAELQAQISKIDHESGHDLTELEILKRKTFKEAEHLRWNALREYAEKLVLITQAATAIVPLVPSVPPSKQHPYTGSDATTSIRAALQKALDTYQPGSDRLVLPQATASDLKRSDTRSFGETHAEELNKIASSHPPQAPIAVTPPTTTAPLPVSDQPNHESVDPSRVAQSNPAAPTLPTVEQLSSPPVPTPLNLTPTTIPQAPVAAPIIEPGLNEPITTLPPALPTVAETGIPKVAGGAGPGPASGSLLDIKAERETHGKAPEHGDHPNTVIQDKAPEVKPKWETAEEEKARLKREERERILGGDGEPASGSQSAPPQGDDDPELPPYQEFQS